MVHFAQIFPSLQNSTAEWIVMNSRSNMQQKTATKKYTIRRLTKFNGLKLEILRLCRDGWISSREIADKIPDHPRDQVQSRVSALHWKYDRPYLRMRTRKGKPNQFKLTVKGKRVLGKLLKLFRNGEPLHIVWKTKDSEKSLIEQIKERSINFDPKNEKPKWAVC